MSDPNPPVWLPAEEAPELAPPPPELLVPGADPDLVVAPLVGDPVAVGGPAEPPAAPPAEPGADADPAAGPEADTAPTSAAGEEEIPPEILAALPVELLGIAPRTVLSPDPFVAWGFGLGAVALILSLIPPVWWMFGLVLGATAARVGWTAWVRSTGLYAGTRARALAVLALAGVALAIGLVAAVRFFAAMSQVTIG